MSTIRVIGRLAARNLPEALRWVGAPLLLAGLSTSGLGVLIWTGVWIWPVVTVPVSGTNLQMQRALCDIGRAFAQRPVLSMAWQGVELTMWGLMK
jgi:hypothetical protein